MVDQDKNPTQIQKGLKGVNYPATKQELIDHAKKGSGDNSDVLKVLKQLPDKKYHSPVEVSKAIGNIE